MKVNKEAYATAGEEAVWKEVLVARYTIALQRFGVIMHRNPTSTKVAEERRRYIELLESLMELDGIDIPEEIPL